MSPSPSWPPSDSTCSLVARYVPNAKPVHCRMARWKLAASERGNLPMVTVAGDDGPPTPQVDGRPPIRSRSDAK